MHSRIFDEFARIMSEKGLLKTADKKDTDYNIIPDKAGPDSKTDKTGYELIEIAHPAQVQVFESRLQDGIVENGVERQKVMIDVALRNPRGVLASLMKTLVKAATILDLEMSDESIKMASEVDAMIEKLAREALRSEDIIPLVEEVINRFGDLDFSILGFGERKQEKEIVYKAGLALKKFLTNAKTAGQDIGNVIQELASYLKQNHQAVSGALTNTRDWGDDADEAREAWDNLKLVTDQWYQEPAKPEASEQQTPGVANKSPAVVAPIGKPPSAHHYSVFSPEVKELQVLLGFSGVDVDSKFGPATFAALTQKATTNSLLNDLLKGKPELAKSYQSWKNADIGLAIQRIQQGNTSAEKAKTQTSTKQPYETDPHYLQKGPGSASPLMVPYENE